MIEVLPSADQTDERVALEIYNAVWPDDAVTMDEVRSFRASMLDSRAYLARVEGMHAGSAVAVVQPERPDRVFTLVAVLPEQRRRGAGSALYEAIAGWASERGLDELEVEVLDDDPESLAFAQRRGFVEERREVGLVLDLSAIEPPPVEPPAGVEIVTWAQRPELARGLYEVALEGLPDIPGQEADEPQAFEDWLAHHMRGSGDLPEAIRRALRRRGRRLLEVFPDEGAADDGAPRPDGGQARLARARHRAGVEGDADPLGEGARLRAAPHAQRGAQRANPPAERALRLPAGRGADLPARPAGVRSRPADQRRRLLSSRSRRRLVSRSAMSRRLSRSSLPRARASSTFARPSLK